MKTDSLLNKAPCHEDVLLGEWRHGSMHYLTWHEIGWVFKSLSF